MKIPSFVISMFRQSMKDMSDTQFYFRLGMIAGYTVGYIVSSGLFLYLDYQHSKVCPVYNTGCDTCRKYVKHFSHSKPVLTPK